MQRRGSTRRRGMLLLVVLLIIALLALVSTTFSYRMHADLAAVKARQDLLQAEQAARAGIDRAIKLLRDQRVDIEKWYNNDQFFRRTLVWAPDKIGGSESLADQEAIPGRQAWRVSVVSYQVQGLDDTNHNTKMRYGVTDEASKININTASRAQLLAFFDQIKPEDVTSEELADALLDWRDKDDSVTSIHGAESSYYMTLDPPYRAKNRPFDTVEELLMVKGFYGRILYGEDYNRNGYLDPNEDDGREGSFPPDDGDGKLNRGLLPYVTVYSWDWNLSNDNKRRAFLNRDFDNANNIPDSVREAIGNEAIIEFITEARKRGYQFKSVGELVGLEVFEDGSSNYDDLWRDYVRQLSRAGRVLDQDRPEMQEEQPGGEQDRERDDDREGSDERSGRDGDDGERDGGRDEREGGRDERDGRDERGGRDERSDQRDGRDSGRDDDDRDAGRDQRDQGRDGPDDQRGADERRGGSRDDDRGADDGGRRDSRDDQEEKDDAGRSRKSLTRNQSIQPPSGGGRSGDRGPSRNPGRGARDEDDDSGIQQRDGSGDNGRDEDQGSEERNGRDGRGRDRDNDDERDGGRDDGRREDGRRGEGRDRDGRRGSRDDDRSGRSGGGRGRGTPVTSPVTAADMAVLLDRLTANPVPATAGLINVNTALPVVIKTIPGITPAQAEAIVEQRSQVDPSELATPAWLLSSGALDAQTFALISNQVTTRSIQFTIDSIGFADHTGAFKRLQAVVEMRGQLAQLKYYRDISSLGMGYPVRDDERSEGLGFDR